MSVNEPFILGLNLVALIAIPVMVGIFAFAVWYGVAHGADGSPVLWARKPRARPEAEREAAE